MSNKRQRKMASFDFIFARANFASDSLTALGSLLRGAREKKRLTMAPARNNERTVLWLRGRGSGIADCSWNFQTLRGKVGSVSNKRWQKDFIKYTFSRRKSAAKKERKKGRQRERGKTASWKWKTLLQKQLQQLAATHKGQQQQQQQLELELDSYRSRRQSRSWSRRQSRSRRQRQSRSWSCCRTA